MKSLKTKQIEEMVLQSWQLLSKAAGELVSARKALGLSAHEGQKQLFQIKMVQTQAEKNIEYCKNLSATKRYL